MNVYVLALIFGALAIPALLGMWLGWRGRTKRDASLPLASHALTGAVIAEFPHASYVSTTPVGRPFDRLALPGLRYKGYADVTVRTDGVSVAVTGEEPVIIPAAQLLGSGTAQGRIGKAVERDGLSLLRWTTSESRTSDGVESSFRFPEPADQRRFADAIAGLTESGTNSPTHNTTQEDA